MNVKGFETASRQGPDPHGLDVCQPPSACGPRLETAVPASRQEQVDGAVFREKEVNKMDIDPSTTKYLISAKLSTDGIVEKPDIVGAIFGQTEGLLGDELDLRDLQKSGRIGRIEVEVSSSKGKSEGIVYVPSSLDQVETAILASSLETIDRVGPCKARISIEKIEDVRVSKRNKIIERAKQLLTELLKASKVSGVNLADSVRQSVQIEEVMHYGKERLPAGPNIEDSDAIIVVEGLSLIHI